MKKILLLLVVLFGVLVASSQSPVDSLLRLCVNASEKQKSELYLQLSLNLKNDSAKSNAYSKMAYQFAVKYNQIPFQAKALYYLGETLFNSADYQSAIPAYQKALTVYSGIKDTANIVDCFKAIGLCYYHMDQGDKAITQFIDGMKLCENDKKNTAKLLSNIAMTHNRMRNMNDAIQNYRKALALNASIKNFTSMAINYNGLGEIYKTMNRPDSALINYLKAKDLHENIEFTAVTLSNIAGIYMNYPDSMNKAVNYLKQAWSIFGQLGLYQYEAEFKQGIGIILYKQGKYKSAIEAFEQSIELNDKYNRGYKIKTTSHNLLSKVYEKTGNYQTSLKHMKLFIQYSDSLAQNEKYEQIATLEKQYETVKKENEINRLQAEREITLIQLRKNKQLKQLGMATVSLLLLLVFFVYMKYLDKIKSNKLLREKNELIEQSEQELRLLNASKNKFFSIIAHDLKNPLHTILGYSYLLNKDYDRFNEEARRKFALNIHQSTNNIFRLLQNLLEWSRSQTGRLNFSPAVVEYQRILDNSLSVLRSMADQKNIVIKAENDPELEIFADPSMIETVLRNLIGNAIKFTPEGGQIEVSAKRENGQILVSVSDTGIGITEEDSKNLFLIDSKVKRKGTNNEDGSGLGLILCQEFVDKHDGKIWVESTLGKGSAFTFSIPAKAIA
ncbi:MAG: tetratricopeptide repeat-containing sensor histidine kinase [Prolixibacteraceae bacterium]|nr:tetratricopeptide repeat-containing sensor histidine kinase [Prolixibacteraceae bacterium]